MTKFGVLQKVFGVWIMLFGLQSIARTFLVTDSSDTGEFRTLRGAIIAANANREEYNCIILSRNTYHLTIAGADEDASRTGDLDITKGHLTIIGHGSVIDATGLGDRVFQVFSNAQLTLLDVVITGGTGADYGEPGGGIYNDGVLTMVNCILTNNFGGGGYGLGHSLGGINNGFGGAIYNNGHLKMVNCAVSGNSSGSGVWSSTGGSGGGIANFGNAYLLDSIVRENKSGNGAPPGEGVTRGNDGGTGGDGAGIYNGGVIVLRQCAISDNICGSGSVGGAPGYVASGTVSGNGGDGGNGGGLYNVGTLAATNCIFRNNSCGSGGSGGSGSFTGGSGGNGGSGAGICNTGTAIFVGCIVSNNICGSGGNGVNGDFSVAGTGGDGGSGGGILNLGDGTNVKLFNNLIALNSIASGGVGGTFSLGNQEPSGANGVGPDLAGNFTSEGYNLVGESNGSIGLVDAVNDDIVGTIEAPANPLLFHRRHPQF